MRAHVAGAAGDSVIHGDRAHICQEPHHPQTTFAQEQRQHAAMKTLDAGVFERGAAAPPSRSQQPDQHIEGLLHVIGVCYRLDAKVPATLEPSSMTGQRCGIARLGCGRRRHRVLVERQIRQRVDFARHERHLRRRVAGGAADGTPERGITRDVAQLENTPAWEFSAQPRQHRVGARTLVAVCREQIDAIRPETAAEQRDARVRQSVSDRQRDEASKCAALAQDQH